MLMRFSPHFPTWSRFQLFQTDAQGSVPGVRLEELDTAEFEDAKVPLGLGNFSAEAHSDGMMENDHEPC